LLDAAGLYFRAYFALPDSMTAPDGTPVNAVRGFTDTVARILTDRRPTRMVACLDADWRPQFRVDLLPSYKAHRVAESGENAEEVPDTLTPQVPMILEVLAAAGIATGEAAGFEADDVIGTLATREQAAEVEVVTGDRDLFQLVREQPTRTTVIYVGKGWAKAELLGEQEIAERYGVPLESAGAAYADMSMMRGDPSDGLPGVAGIGEKTAAKLITEFGSLRAIIDAADAGDRRLTPKNRERIIDAADYLAVAPKVVCVAHDAPVSLSTVDDQLPERPADLEALRDLGERWNIGGSIDRLVTALALPAPTS
jgi:5'-3' exonuclease